MELEELDPAQEAAKDKTEKALDQASYYETVEDLMKTVPALINPSQSVLIMVEAPTSKLSTNFKLLDQATALMKKISTNRAALIANGGHRIDLAAAMLNKGNMELQESQFMGPGTPRALAPGVVWMAATGRRRLERMTATGRDSPRLAPQVSLL
jgi:hypothetical protein